MSNFYHNNNPTIGIYPRRERTKEIYDYLDRKGLEAMFLEEKEIGNFDLLFLNTTDENSFKYALKGMKEDVKCVNDYRSNLVCEDRIKTLEVLENEGIEVPQFKIPERSDLNYLTPKNACIDPPFLRKSIHELEKGKIENKLVKEDDEKVKIRKDCFFQKYVEGDGTDLKIYVAGEEVRAVRVNSPLFEKDPEIRWEVKVNERMKELSNKCRKGTGCEIFGIDVIGDKVIEVNSFPSWDGIESREKIIGEYLIKEVKKIVD